MLFPLPRGLRITARVFCATLAVCIASATRTEGADAIQPSNVTVVKIPGAEGPLAAVRRLAGWYIAIEEAKLQQGIYQSKVWFSSDARNWELRFTSSEALEDVALAWTEHLQARTLVLVLSDSARRTSVLRPDMPTWISTDDGLTWQEIRGEIVRSTVSPVDGALVARDVRVEGDVFHEQVKVTRDAKLWVKHETLPPKLKSARPPARWDGRQVFHDQLYKADSHPTAKWAIMSSSNLKQWQEECLIPTPAPGKEHEMQPLFAASEDMLLAGTMVATGAGPVRFYRRKFLGEGWERITPVPTWNFLHGLSYAGGRFLAMASREDLRVSQDGLRWKVVAQVRPHSPRFAVGVEGEYVFAGRDGTVTIVKPDESWDNFSGVPEPSMQSGANWEKEATSRKADALFSLARSFGAGGPNPDAHNFLLEAAAVAETGSPEVRLLLGMIILQGSLGVPKDAERGIRLIASAAEAGNAAARLTYGMALMNGAGGLVPVDAAKGAALLQAAVREAETASAEAKFQIVALLLQGGPGIPADRPRAFAVLAKSAEEGFAPSQFNYGQVLLAGTPEVPADVPRGLEMLKNAAHQKVPDAAALLGQIYEAGRGVPADLKEAKNWYALALNLGVKAAQPALERVESNLKAGPP